MTEKKARVGTVDFFKFIFSMIIVFCHANNFFSRPGSYFAMSGFIAVEFFFIVSGYLLAAKASKFKGGSVWEADLAMLRGKFLHIFPYLFLSNIVAHVAYSLPKSTPQEIWHRMLFSTTDFFAVQMEGYPGFIGSGVSWYLSALFMVSFIIYPLLCTHRKLFSRYIAPISAVFLLGYISKTVYGLSYPDYWYGHMFEGMLRGFAEMSLGCAAFELKGWLDTDDDKNRRIYGFFEIGGYAATILALFHKESDIHDFLIVPLIFMCVSISFSNKSALARLFSGKITGPVSNWLGIFSLSIYLNHYYVARNLPNLVPHLGRYRMMALYLAISGVLAALNYIVGRRFARLVKDVKRAVLAVLIFLIAAEGLYLGNELRITMAVRAFGGRGTEEQPYQVDTKEELDTLRDLVNGGAEFRETWFLQTADIDLAGENWLPIGLHESEHYFYGTYDGGNHVIENLTIESDYERDTGNVGLFGMLLGTVRNLGIESGDISGEFAAAIASQGMKGAKIINCYNCASIHGVYRAAGICDNLLNSSVINCVNDGIVEAPDCAPILSYNAGTVAGIDPGRDQLPATFKGSYNSEIVLEGYTVRELLNSGIDQLVEAGVLKDGEATYWE